MHATIGAAVLTECLGRLPCADGTPAAKHSLQAPKPGFNLCRLARIRGPHAALLDAAASRAAHVWGGNRDVKVGETGKQISARNGDARICHGA